MIITVSSILNVPVAQAWASYTEPQHIVHWNFAADTWHCPNASNELREGGMFDYRMEAKDGSFGFNLIGTHQKVVPLEQIDTLLGDGRSLQTVFEALSNTQTKVTQHFEAETQNPAEMQQAGWQAILENYKKHTESL
jgi:uncharacterized protein YndB with AHSA1/START domain